MKFSLVVFDWDGTLMDSTHSIVVAIQHTCRDLGLMVPTEKQASWVIGLSLEEAFKQAVPELPMSRMDEFVQRYKFHYLTRDPDLRLFPGNAQILDELKARNVQIAIATGKSRMGLNRALANHRLEPYFDATRTADETHSKPHPLMLWEIMDELAVSPEHTVMIGDTTHDIGLAKNAGVVSIAVSYGAHSRHELEAANPDFMVDSVEDLRRLLRVYTSCM